MLTLVMSYYQLFAYVTIPTTITATTTKTTYYCYYYYYSTGVRQWL